MNMIKIVNYFQLLLIKSLALKKKTVLIIIDTCQLAAT